MTDKIALPSVNFSRDLRAVSLAIAGIAGVFLLAALGVTAFIIFETGRYQEVQERIMAQTGSLEAEAASLRRQHKQEPPAAAISELRQRIISLNALDFGQAPPVTRVLLSLEELMPPEVALQSLDYDRAKGSLELVAVSAASEQLTNFFDVASRSRFFKTVRLIDKKQAGASEEGVPMYQVRLSISLVMGEPKA